MKVKMNRKRITLVVVLALLLAGGLAWRMKPAGPADATPAAPASALTVNVAAPQLQNWPQEVQASGTLAAWQEVIVSPETGGLRIAELAVDVGATVRRGQLMARLADDTVRAEVNKQQAIVAQAEARLGKASMDLRRAGSVDVADAVSPQRMDEYRAAEATERAALASARADLDTASMRLAHTRILAPDDGVVASRTGVLGNVVATGAELYRLVRKGRIEWQAELDARQLAGVRTGQPASVTLPDGTSAQGQVRLVSPTLSGTTGRGIVYVSLAAQPGVRPGVFASGRIVLESRPALTLPQTAVVLRDGRSYVYVVDATSKVASRPVVTGRRQAERVEVVSGLDAGTRVVASGAGFLSEGATVTVAAQPQGAAR